LTMKQEQPRDKTRKNVQNN